MKEWERVAMRLESAECDRWKSQETTSSRSVKKKDEQKCKSPEQKSKQIDHEACNIENRNCATN